MIMAAGGKIVLVAGATGRAGRCIISELLKRGYGVRALLVPPFDPPDPPGLRSKGVELVAGDLASVPSLEKAMDGAAFLISAIGSKKPFSKAENDRIDNMGNQNLARAARAKGLQKIVIISSVGAGNSRNALSFMYKVMMSPILRAKEKSEAFIQSYGMTYTIVRPGGYGDKEVSGRIAFGEGGKITGRVTREQIAKVCVDALANQAMNNRTFEVVDEATVAPERRQFIIKI
jgi:uncharacterized protein YbjT (DUF2867 family)